MDLGRTRVFYRAFVAVLVATVRQLFGGHRHDWFSVRCGEVLCYFMGIVRRMVFLSVCLFACFASLFSDAKCGFGR